MDVFVARQPILDPDQTVQGYELLFRAGAQNAFQGEGGSKATSEIVQNAIVNIGLAKLTRGRRAFINFSKELILAGMPTLLPSDQVVIQITEELPATQQALRCIREYQKRKYTLVFDSFVVNKTQEEFLEYADVVRVDFKTADKRRRKAVAKALKGRDIKLLAGNVETPVDFKEATKFGYHLFSGTFFKKPVVVSGKAFEPNDLAMMEIMREVHRVNLDYTTLETAIKRDVALSYNLMRMVNSTALRRAKPIDSIGHALVMLGTNEIKKWVSLVVMAKLGKSKPSVLLIQSLARGRFLELVADLLKLGSEGEDLFLLGMFSLIDALMNRSLHDLMAEVPLKDEIKDALLGHKSRYSLPYKFMIAYERADWASVNRVAYRYKIPDNLLPGMYLEATNWAHQNLEEMKR